MTGSDKKHTPDGSPAGKERRLAPQASDLETIDSLWPAPERTRAPEEVRPRRSASEHRRALASTLPPPVTPEAVSQGGVVVTFTAGTSESPLELADLHAVRNPSLVARKANAAPLEQAATVGNVAGALLSLRGKVAMGDFTGALTVAEAIVASDPNNNEAVRCAAHCHGVLVQMYSARLGDLSQIVTVQVQPDQIRWLSLDHRAGFLLSLIDERSNIEQLLDISGMSRLDALRILHGLFEQHIIALAPGH